MPNNAAPEAKPAVTAANALFAFYDIESLPDLFTVACYLPRTATVEVFFLLDPGTPLHAAVFADLPAAARAAREAILAKNPAYHPVPASQPDIRFHDLAAQAGCDRLATVMGLFEGERVNDPGCSDVHGGRFRPVCDTDPSYDPIGKHPYLAGYNSYNYDTTMLACFFHEAYAEVRSGRPFVAASARAMRAHNDELFSDRHKSLMPSYLTTGSISGGQGWSSNAATIRSGMLDSGRHLDVARLNEAQRLVGLKRLLGGLGRQILESDRLDGHAAAIESIEDFSDLVAYNVSDVVGLAKLFELPVYSSTFDLKKGLLDQYPEVVYDKDPKTGRARLSRSSVRRGRLAPDSTSAKFVARILAPYKPLGDIPAVSFLYPAQEVADETGRERRNVLEDCVAFFESTIDCATPEGRAARAQFQHVVDYYREIEGKNFNDSDEYATQFGDAALQPSRLADIPKTPNNIPYFRADGTPTACFATFSTGGIHGAEADTTLVEELENAHKAGLQQIRRAREAFPEAGDFLAEASRQHNMVRLPDGSLIDKRNAVLGSRWRKPKPENAEQCRQLALARSQLEHPEDVLALQRPESEKLDVTLEDGFVLHGKAVLADATKARARYRDEPAQARPEMFETRPDGSTKLKPKFARTSIGHVIHEDFTSYYPNLLRNMRAFYNEDLGEDRYAKIFEDKQRYGALMKQPGVSPEEKARLEVLRGGTKLILNAASGAGDTSHKTGIRMNNQIISMRIIGQLFSWRIGQAQTAAGANIVSTNTDGLYSDLEGEANNAVLAREAALIGVEIEPEPMLLVSKDSNNRLELALPPAGTPLHEAQILSASGGTLACHKEPQPTKSLAHPAVLDWALVRYLREIVGGRTVSGTALSLDRPMDHRVATWLMRQARDQTDALLAVRLFQNVLAASAGKVTFPFAVDDATGRPRALQHYNRVFVVKEQAQDTCSIRNAGSWVVNAASRLKRARDEEAPVADDREVALPILEANGFTRDGKGGTRIIPADQDVAVHNVPGVDPAWHMLIDNRDLAELDPPELREQILDRLDLDAYAGMLASTFEKNWMNRTAGDQASGPADGEPEQDAAESAEDPAA